MAESQQQQKEKLQIMHMDFVFSFTLNILCFNCSWKIEKPKRKRNKEIIYKKEKVKQNQKRKKGQKLKQGNHLITQLPHNRPFESLNLIFQTHLVCCCFFVGRCVSKWQTLRGLKAWDIIQDRNGAPKMCQNWKQKERQILQQQSKDNKDNENKHISILHWNVWIPTCWLRWLSDNFLSV